MCLSSLSSARLEVISKIPGIVRYYSYGTGISFVSPCDSSRLARILDRVTLLVAVPDPHGPAFPAAAHGFAPLPEQRFDFPSLIVASDNDSYSGIEHARHCAQAWGSRLHYAGALGHINAASGLGDWDKGWELLEELSRSTKRPT
jgi:predicted alpha/beta hydrolase family esterase